MNSAQFENHPIFDKLDQFILHFNDNEINSALEAEKSYSYLAACNYIQDRLKITIPALVQEAELNTITNELEEGVKQVNAFVGNKNPGHLKNADTNFTSALNRIRNLPIQLKKNDFDFSKNVASFGNIVQSKLKDIEKENQELKQNMQTMQKNLDSKQKELDTLSGLVTTKTNELNNLASKFQTAFDNFISTSKQQVTNDRNGFKSEVEQDRNTFRKEVDTDKQKFSKEIEEKISGIDWNTNEIVQNIQKKLDEAKSLVNVIGNVGVTGNYQKIANEHKKAANSWRILAIVFMAGLSILLIITIWDISSANYDWIKSLIRVIAAAALSYPATYAAKESSKHRKLETINRKLELELASLTPFIELLPEDKKQEIKADLVKNYFGNSVDLNYNSNDDKEEELSLGGFEKILKAIIPLLKK